MTKDLDVKKHNMLKGCLLIHGFGGSISEVKPLADFLTEQGYSVECPALKGHTGKRNDLKLCSYKEWIASARESYYKLEVECSIIYIIGFSMGGLVGFQLAKSNRVDKIVTLNTPIYYWDIKRIVLNIAEDIRVGKFNNLRRYLNSACKLPIQALLNFRILLSKTKPVLREVHCPAFTVQALQDDTVHKSSADYIYRNIGSIDKRIKFYDGSGHHILWSKVAGNVINDVADFLQQ